MTAESALVETWRELMSGYGAIARDLDRELQAEHGLVMSDYEVLERLVADCRGKARVQELDGPMGLSQSALSRTVARLEKCGLVERAVCGDDRRGVFVTPTPVGRERRAEARRTYLKVLARHLG